MSSTLDDFIKRYIKNKELSDTPEGYSEWLSSYGNTQQSLGGRLAEIEDTCRAARSTYGKNAEQLASAGLSRSGYGDYLNTAAYEERETARKQAYRDAAAARDENRRGYGKYLAALSSEKSALSEKAYTAIQKDGTLDTEEAYRRALALGLDEESAAEVAKNAVADLKKKASDSIRLKLASGKLSAEGAVAYALALGFTREEAALFAAEKETEEKENATVGKYDGNGSFTDYLRNKLNKK